ncbi:MAG: hypothetical protein IPJ46_11930 [Anaerolineales bacterium]|nr:hypothetical protein [Anaerolineales bacterium]
MVKENMQKMGWEFMTAVMDIVTDALFRSIMCVGIDPLRRRHGASGEGRNRKNETDNAFISK